MLTRIPEHQSEPIYLTFSKIISEHDDDNSQDFKSNLVKIGIEYLSYVNNNPHLANTPTSGAGSGAKIGLGTGLATGLGKSTAPHQQTEATIAQSAINIIQNDLLMGKYFQAFGQLKKAFLGNVITPSMHVYLLWAKIGHALAANLKVNLPKYENEIEKLSAEDKATAEYEYISAMLAKLKNDKANSERHYQAAVQKNPVYLKFPINKNFLTKILSTIGIKR